MKSLQKLIITTIILAPMSVAYAASASGSSTGDIAAVNLINVTANGVTINPSEDGSGTFSGTDAYTLGFSNNNVLGYVVSATPTNGYFKVDSFDGSGTPQDGEAINYKLACDGFNTLASTSEAISPHSVALVDGSSAINIYNVASPSAATCVGDAGGCDTKPNCDISLADDEDIDEHFGGAYSETITYEIVNNT